MGNGNTNTCYRLREGIERFLITDINNPAASAKAQSETFIMLDGEVSFRIGDDVHEATGGTTIFVPKGVVHSFHNTGKSIAKMLFMYSPAGMDGMFAEIGSPGTRGVQAPPLDPADVAKMIAVAAKYKFTIVPG